MTELLTGPFRGCSGRMQPPLPPSASVSTLLLPLCGEALTWQPSKETRRRQEQNEANLPSGDLVQAPVLGSEPLPLWWFHPPSKVPSSWEAVINLSSTEALYERPLGYRNMGNTCFANSVFQMLNFIPELYHLAFHKAHSTGCQRRKGGVYCGACHWESHVTLSWNNDSENRSAQRSHRSSRDAISSAKHHQRGGYIEPLILNKLLESRELKSIRMRRGPQHCSHEFLMALMRFLVRYEIPPELGHAFDRNRIQDAERCTTQYSQILTHPRLSQKKCLSCGHKTVSVDYDYEIPLMPKEFKSSLEESLAYYFRKTLLGDGAKVKCESCKQEVNKSLRQRIARLPPVLCIALHRTHNVPSSGHVGLVKSDKMVRVPDELDLKAYTVRPKSGVDVRSPSDYLYDLQSFVHHSGGADSGHYVAYGKNALGQWYCCNDEKVSCVERSKVAKKASEAFLLCYSKRTATRLLSKDDYAHGWPELRSHAVQVAEGVLKNVAQPILYGNDRRALSTKRSALGLVDIYPPKEEVLLFEHVQPFITGRKSSLPNPSTGTLPIATVTSHALNRPSTMPSHKLGLRVVTRAAGSFLDDFLDRITRAGIRVHKSDAMMNQSPIETIESIFGGGDEYAKSKKINNKANSSLSINARGEDLTKVKSQKKRRKLVEKRRLSNPFVAEHSPPNKTSISGWSDDSDHTDTSSPIPVRNADFLKELNRVRNAHSKNMGQKLHLRDEHEIEIDSGKKNRYMRRQERMAAGEPPRGWGRGGSIRGRGGSIRGRGGQSRGGHSQEQPYNSQDRPFHSHGGAFRGRSRGRGR